MLSQTNLRARVLSGIRWSAGARLTSQIVTWAITLIVIRLLSPSDYGLLAMANVFVALLAMLSEFGLGSAIVQRADIGEGELKKVLGVILLIHFALASLLIVSAPLIAALFTEVRLVPIVRVLSLQFVLAAFGIVPDSLLQRRLEFRSRSLLDLSAAILGGLVALALALGGCGVWALVASTLFMQGWRTVGANLLAPFRRLPDFSLRGMRPLISFGGNVTASQVLWFFFSQADMLIAGRWLGKELLGFYSVAMHLASLPNQRVSSVVNQIAFPAFSRMQHDVHKVGASILLGVRVLSFFSIPISWGISSVAPEIVAVILGSKWSSAVIPLQVLSLIMPIRTIGNFVPNAIQGMGRSDILLRNAAFGCLVLPVAFLIGVHWGLLGLSVAWVIAAPIVFVQNMLTSLPAMGVRLGQVTKAALPTLTSGGAMYLAVMAIRSTLSPVHSGVVELILLILGGAFAYSSTSLVLNRKGVREVVELIRAIWTTEHIRFPVG